MWDTLVLEEVEPVARKELQTLYVTKTLHRKLAVIAASKGITLRSLTQVVLANFADLHEVTVGPANVSMN